MGELDDETEAVKLRLNRYLNSVQAQSDGGVRSNTAPKMEAREKRIEADPGAHALRLIVGEQNVIPFSLRWIIGAL